MCIGEGSSDTLDAAEQVFIRTLVAKRLPGYGSDVRNNDDSLTWIVLKPAHMRGLPRFTICRIDPCIMVMVEDGGKQRRFASMANVEEAIDFACGTVHASALALRNVHAAPEMAQ